MVCGNGIYVWYCNPIFPIGGRYDWEAKSIIIQRIGYGWGWREWEYKTSDASKNLHFPLPLSVTLQLPGADPEGAGYGMLWRIAYDCKLFSHLFCIFCKREPSPPFRQDGDGTVFKVLDWWCIQFKCTLPIPKTQTQTQTLADYFCSLKMQMPLLIRLVENRNDGNYLLVHLTSFSFTCVPCQVESGQNKWCIKILIQCCVTNDGCKDKSTSVCFTLHNWVSCTRTVCPMFGRFR